MRVPWRLRDVFAIFGLTLVLGGAAGALLSWASDAGILPERAAMALALPLTPVLLGVVSLGYLALRFPGTAPLAFGRSVDRRRDVWVGVRAGLVAFAVQLLVGGLVARLTDVPLEELQQPLRQAARDPVLRPFFVVAAVVLAPVSEELFFRGLTYRVLRARMRARLAMPLSAAFFALLHVSVGTSLVASGLLFMLIFLLGIALAWLVERRQSLIGPIAMHATFNLLGVVPTVFLPA